MSDKIYLVTVGKDHRLIQAASASKAIKFALRGIVGKAEKLDALQLSYALKNGLQIEKAEPEAPATP